MSTVPVKLTPTRRGVTSRLPGVSGHCPECGTASLFLGDGGYVTCSWIDCPNPDAAAAILDDGREVEHIVTLTARTFSVLHPLRERIGGALLDCPLGEHLASLSRPPAPPGRYRATSVGDGWHWEALP